MAWFWNANKKTKREIYMINKYGGKKSPILEVIFHGRGPDGGREVRHVNMLTEKDPMILKAIKNYADEEYRNRLIFGMEFIKKNNFKIRKDMHFMMINRETLETYFCDYDTFIKHVKNFK